LGDERQRDDRERARDSEKEKDVAVIHITACQERKTELDILPQGAPEGAQALTGPVTDRISLVVKISV